MLYLSKLSAYLRPSSLLDFFKTNDTNFLTMHIQDFFNSPTTPLLKYLSYLSSDSNIFYTSSSFNLTSQNLIGSIDNIISSNLSTQFLGSMSAQITDARKYTVAEELRVLLPKYKDIIETFEVLSVNVDNSLYAHLSLPPVKLYYPEPFVASPSFVHEDVWFIHILHFQHWLWFFFISIIMFYFIVFINVVRWCNPRNKPKRETRGVSRSKCADLITACVPVSWAMSIIISASVNATDYYDGFGTGEFTIGIRAYQWGWAYYYPLSIHKDYSENYSTVTGNSLKYSKYSNNSSESTALWKNQNTPSSIKHITSPTHAILSPSDNSKILNFINFNSLGTTTMKESTAFRSIQFSSKSNPSNLFHSSTNYSVNYSRIADLYLNDILSQDSSNSISTRQQNYILPKATTRNLNSGIDKLSTDSILSYNYNIGSNLANTLKPTTSGITGNLLAASNIFKSKSIALGRGFNAEVDSLATNLTSSNYITTASIDKLVNTGTTHRGGLSDDGLLRNPNFSLRSSNQQLLSFEKNVRNINNLSVDTINTNFSDTSHNLLSDLDTKFMGIVRKASTTLALSHIPTSHLGFRGPNITFDKLNPSGLAPDMLMDDKSPLILPFFYQTPWSTLWSNSDFGNRYHNLDKYGYTRNQVIVSPPLEYANYDFITWKLLELLEDLFWESSYSYYTQDDFMNSLNSTKLLKKLKAEEMKFNKLPKSKLYLDSDSVPLTLDVDYNFSNMYTPVFNDSLYIDISLTDILSLNMFNSEVEVDSNERSYASNKGINYLFYKNYLHTLNLDTSKSLPLAYSQVLNMYRSGFDESQFSSELFNTKDAWLGEGYSPMDNMDNRLYNTLKLRKPSRSFIQSFAAFQKVYRSRFDQSASHANISDLSNTPLKYLFLSEKRIKYESMLGKNTISYYDSVPYKNSTSNVPNFTSPLLNSTNTYFASIPFLLSRVSDSVKYTWFGHQSRWTPLEVQPSSVARYSLLGLPYLSHNFEFNSLKRDTIVDSASYTTRLFKARKNYVSNWSTSPFLYARLSNWYSTHNLVSELFNTYSTKNVWLSLKLSNNYWCPKLNTQYTSSFTPSYTDVSTPGRSSWKPNTGAASYMYNTSILAEILTKRENLYSEYFLNSGYGINLPEYLRATPSNTLFSEVKKVYRFIDPSNFIPEVSRDFYYTTTLKTNLNLINKLSNTVSPTVINYLFNNLFYYSLNNNLHYLGQFDNLSTKNQYRPMRKGISNMVRLHATGAVAMPTEVRLHILASSRDIIHSWAIPSAGIKIDCIPGYSSHRVAIFLTSGIFWGQCMEICGRFHHWMPIVVYFMRRDAFFLWSLTFVHYRVDNRRYSSSYFRHQTSRLRLN